MIISICFISIILLYFLKLSNIFFGNISKTKVSAEYVFQRSFLGIRLEFQHFHILWTKNGYSLWLRYKISIIPAINVIKHRDWYRGSGVVWYTHCCKVHIRDRSIFVHGAPRTFRSWDSVFTIVAEWHSLECDSRRKFPTSLSHSQSKHHVTDVTLQLLLNPCWFQMLTLSRGPNCIIRNLLV